MDFRNFFPSLLARDLEKYCTQNAANLTSDEVAALTRILFWKPRGTQDLRLSIGAPSSPVLSNLLLYEFDTLMAEFCSRDGTSFTRYADDLSFGSEDTFALQRVEEEVARVCKALKSPNLTLNRTKTVRVSKMSSRRVTGLVITNSEKVSLGRDTKRLIRARVHHFVKGMLSEEECSSLRGMLAFVNSVEPEFLLRLKLRYGAEAIRRIQTS